MAEPSIPDGFEPLPLASGFVKLAGPFLGRRSDGRVDVGYAAQTRQTDDPRNTIVSVKRSRDARCARSRNCRP